MRVLLSKPRSLGCFSLFEPGPYTFICNATGDELPEMVAHWENLERLLGAPLVPVRHTLDLIALCESQQALPNWRQRWCTRMLKIEPTIAYFDQLPDDATLFVGLRADEELRKGLYGEDINVRFPLRELGWGLTDVVAYLDKRGVCNPERTDCGACFYQRLDEWRTLYLSYPDRYWSYSALEKKIGHTFRSPGRDAWPADLESLAREFDKGRVPRKYNRGVTCRVCSL